MTKAANLFRSIFGAEADGVWAAPGRVNLIGEHTDYNDGLVLPFALAQRTEVAIRLRTDGVIRMSSALAPNNVVGIPVKELAPGWPAGWGAYVAGVPWALEGDVGFDAAIDSSVPVGAGLSSSAALICAVGLGINDLLSLGYSRRELARRTRRTENEYVGAPTGGMDQIAALLCIEGHALLYDVREDTTEQVPFDPSDAGLKVLVVDTQVRHGHVDGEYAKRRADCEQAAEQLGVPTLRDVAYSDLDAALNHLDNERLVKRVRHVVTENQRVRDTAAALASDDWVGVGELLTAAHASIRDDFEASCTELDVAVAMLMESGALGARMTGGGFGGAAIALVPHAEADEAAHTVRAVFADNGFVPPTIFSVVPSAGATRIK
ncbi:MAG: galactokinase [Acidimicrobiia bacterium]|nr:galactokinase [Acidimicrobiia bacterium]